jgi:multiphosphoryl transfer protein
MPSPAPKEAKSPLDAPAGRGASKGAQLVPVPSPLPLYAPLSGVIVPLDAVPDPVFAGRMAGDGVAIDPTSQEVLSPHAGRVTQLHDKHHAIAVTSDEGIEVLVHVGLDTVTLGGRGFTPLVARGDRVVRGQPLLRFDADQLARSARSLLSVVLVTSGAGPLESRARGRAIGGETVLLQAPPLQGAEEDGPGGDEVLSEPISLPNKVGLHARPAAVLANEARRFHATIELEKGSAKANAKSIVAVLGLSTKRGDEVRLRAVGVDAAAAVETLSRLLAAGCGEQPHEAPTAPISISPAPVSPVLVAVEGALAGVAAAPGVAIGKAFRFQRSEPEVPETSGAPQDERRELDLGIEAARKALQALQRSSSGAQAQVLGVQESLLEDPELVDAARSIVAEGKSAAFAWKRAYTDHAAQLEALGDPLLRERATDLRDLGRRVLTALLPQAASKAQAVLPDGAIVLAEELTPSEFAALSAQQGKLAGLCTTGGGVTSHVAILARAADVPCVCGADAAVLSVAEGAEVILDGTRGLLIPAPTGARLEEARARAAAERARAEQDRAAAHREARTSDGHRIEVAANVKDLAEAQAALAAGAEGVGLLRSEFLFEGRDSAPSEEEQASAYKSIARVLAGRRFVVRTLDVGGDKPLSYVPMPHEENPFLGLRGVRLSLARPELFRAQLRAILRAAGEGDVHVMFPMVAGLDELRAARAHLDEARRELATDVQLKVGVMVEVPSAALLADALARECDFLSIGTNDLTQYTLAMDRGDPRFARQADPLHPAVLRLISYTTDGAHRQGKWVGVCGGLASEALAAPLLLGLGVDELSAAVPAVASVKAELMRWTLLDCKALAAEALSLDTPAQVRALLASRKATSN